MFAALAPDYDLEFARAISTGLRRRQKTVPACWLYDALGSSLFEAITLLPEYGLTRADAELLQRCAPSVMEAAGSPRTIVELGSGTGTKTRYLLEAAANQGRVRYLPIDISASALRNCELTLGGMPQVEIEGIAAGYFEGLDLALARRQRHQPVMLLFLGSTIGNLMPPERAEFLRNLRRRLAPGDTLLLGTDLMKPSEVLVPAYDDALGITAAFNRNLLVRINRELGGRFELSGFAHEARYNQRQSRIEMHLRSLTPQQVYIEELNLRVDFKRDETIWTECCHKFTLSQVRSMSARAGWSVAGQWTHDAWGFAETLLAA